MTTPATAPAEDTSGSIYEELADSMLGPETPDDETSETQAAPTEAQPTTPAAPASAEPAQPVVDRGDGRDEKGRFVASTQAPAAPPTPQGLPFQYRAAGQTHALEGAYVNDRGELTVPGESVARVQRAFDALHFVEQGGADIERYQAENQQLRAALEQYTQGDPSAHARNDALVETVLRWLDMHDDDAAFIDEAFRLRATMPGVIARAETDYWKQRAEAPSATEALGLARETIERARVDLQYRDVTADEWGQLLKQVERSPFAFIRPANDQDARLYPGVRPGELVFDSDLLIEQVAEKAQARRSARETAAAARFNAGMQPRPGFSPSAQPQPPVQRPPATPTPPRELTKQERWDATFNEMIRNGGLLGDADE